MSSAPIQIPAAAAEVETPSAFEVGLRAVPLGATMSSTSIDTKNSMTKKELIDQIEQLKKKLEQEKINHTVSMKFLQNQREERQQELNKLQLETGKILQEMEDQFYSLSRKTTQTIDKRMEMMWKINEMKKVVMEDRKEQEKQRQLEAETRAATTLQTWWRRCMVRRQLGPYKKSKDKKFKKKKGNEEKGKKKAGDQKKGKKK
uniref:Dynein regulatory complex protein 9 n=1 Tax=Nothobranchius korthausae TaxID=1143690 RepID=A0A1A8G3C9_9TELE